MAAKAPTAEEQQDPPTPADHPKYATYLEEKALQVCKDIGLTVSKENRDLSPSFKAILTALTDVHQNALRIEKEYQAHDQKMREKDELEVQERIQAAN